MTEVSDKDLGEELLKLAALRDLVNARYAEVHEQMTQRFLASGVERQRWKLGDSEELLGTITKVDAKYLAIITDETAALEWCAEKHPTELETRTVVVQKIRPAFWNRIKAASEKEGIGHDPFTGEFLPWVEVMEKEPSIFVKSSPAAKRRVREVVITDRLPELTG